MKRFKNILFLVIAVVYITVIFSFVAVNKSEVVCGQILPSICDSIDNQFITAQELSDITLEKYPAILGSKLKDMDCNQMEEFFQKHPAIENCEVYFTYGGTLHLDVTQREPLVRVFDNGASYYLDMDGDKMPVFKNHSAHVLVASGYIKRLSSKHDLLLIANAIYSEAFWKAQIEQVYVDEKGELTLVPRVGDHLIEFGKVEDVDAKFRNLKALYTQGWDAREWNLYKKVSLKYKGQVVCTKG
ncbi:cell division protein FtsQ [Carboxylicivirga sp. A043]|uniref:cell division protein FtsQ/DivIB n=1 Tax=Carboxylicivirga litoralis TaxID=2816963 RepID=UPI0021CB783A|nr:cell division protein FtsQ [Carboxylicivirga sp. A043]MCU4156279.1 cell division protein FtsQ [Carboxylicivirga sp. A043]